MSTYEVEFRRVSYITITVNAQTQDEAEQMAWAEIDAGESYGLVGDADWAVESIEKMGGDNQGETK